MKKRYIKPVSSTVHVNLLGTVLDAGGTTLGGQSNNPVSSNVDRDHVARSAKKQGFFDEDEDEEWPKSNSLWE